MKRNEKGKTKTLIRFFDFHELETYYSVVEIDVNDPIDTKANKDYYGFVTNSLSGDLNGKATQYIPQSKI